MPPAAIAAEDPDKKKPEPRRMVRTIVPQGQNGLVTLSGRVVTPGGKFIRNAAVILMDAGTGSTQGVVSGSMGYYQITNIVPGHTYILMVFHNRYLFASPTQFIDINEDIPNVILIGEIEPNL
ncbi:MAG TPA: carboxypeptidase-like regulatory domain-containing protein [Pyrinomonadaceae bacterium]|nr:carboxypeptidase-like regulatory domain-containing protein [Pyrinomonadaceae bacterium]